MRGVYNTSEDFSGQFMQVIHGGKAALTRPSWYFLEKLQWSAINCLIIHQCISYGAFEGQHGLFQFRVINTEEKTEEETEKRL